MAHPGPTAPCRPARPGCAPSAAWSSSRIPTATTTAFDEAFARQLVSDDRGRGRDPAVVRLVRSRSTSACPASPRTCAPPTPHRRRGRSASGCGRRSTGRAPWANSRADATGVLLELPADTGCRGLRRMLDGVFLDLAPVSLSTPADDDGLAAAARSSTAGTTGVDAPETDAGRSVSTRSAPGCEPAAPPTLDAGLADAAALVGDAGRQAPHAQGRGRRRHRVARGRCDRRPGARAGTSPPPATSCAPSSPPACRSTEPAARSSSAGPPPPTSSRRSPSSAPPAACGHASARSPGSARRPPFVPPRRRVEGDDDALRPVGERPAFHRGLLRRRHGRRRRRHDPAARRPHHRRRHVARPSDRPQHPDRPAAGEQPRPRRSTRPVGRGTSNT